MGNLNYYCGYSGAHTNRMWNMQQMKQLFLMLLYLMCTGSASAQDSVTYRQQRIFQYMNDSAENNIYFGCGYAGIYSENLYIITELIAAGRFDLITNLLDSKIPATRYLAVSALLIAKKKSVLKLDAQTSSKINRLKKNTEKITFCSGCTGHWVYSARSLFNPGRIGLWDKRSIRYLTGHSKNYMEDGFKTK